MTAYDLNRFKVSFLSYIETDGKFGKMNAQKFRLKVDDVLKTLKHMTDEKAKQDAIDDAVAKATAKAVAKAKAERGILGMFG